MSKATTTAKVKPGQYVDVEKFIRKDFTPDGKVEIATTSNPEAYIKAGVDVYRNTLKKGDKAGTLQYAIALEHKGLVASSRATVADKIKALKAQGLTAEQIIKDLAGL